MQSIEDAIDRIETKVNQLKLDMRELGKDIAVSRSIMESLVYKVDALIAALADEEEEAGVDLQGDPLPAKRLEGDIL